MKSNLIINLASKEYSDLIDVNLCKGRILTPVFALPSMALKSIRGQILREMAINKVVTENDFLNLEVQGEKIKNKVVDLYIS